MYSYITKVFIRAWGSRIGHVALPKFIFCIGSLHFTSSDWIDYNCYNL